MTRKTKDELPYLREEQSDEEGADGNFITLDIFFKGLKKFPFQCVVGNNLVVTERVAALPQRNILPVSSVTVIPGKPVLNQNRRAQVRI